ncbi:hypothetical protein ACQKE8_12860 [Sphingobium limneticum]|uniref:hypothetical protein n=1 Tax=Sphingobium limneticum TaxID=1007511 RepID=UPI003CFCC3BA
MLHASAEFPFPGSIAVFEGARWRVCQLMDGGIALISKEGQAATGIRRELLADLVDAKLADENEWLTFTDMSEATARIAIHATTLLRDRNDIALRELGIMLKAAADRGRIPPYVDPSHLSRIMRRLGWYKFGYEGEGYERSPLYARRRDQAAKAA